MYVLEQPPPNAVAFNPPLHAIDFQLSHITGLQIDMIKHVKHYVCPIYKSTTRDTHTHTRTRHAVAKIYKSLRYYFKNLPEFMYYESAHYSVFDVNLLP